MSRRPSMLLAAPLWTGASGASLAHGFRNNGWAVQDVDVNRYVPALAGNRLLQVATKALRRASVDEYRRVLSRELEMVKPRVFLTVKGAHVTASLLDKIAKRGVRTALFYPDVDFNHPVIDPDALIAYDFVFTAKSFHPRYLREVGRTANTFHVAHGYSDVAHRPVLSTVADSDYDADVRFIGNYSESKGAVLEELATLRPHLLISVSGPGWANAPLTPRLRSAIRPEVPTNVAYAERIQRARINLAVHHGPGFRGWTDVVSTRTFEIPACGGFMLHPHSVELEDYFTPDVEVGCYDSIRSLVDQVDRYLADSPLRRSVTYNGRIRAERSHSYTARAAAMAAELLR